MKNKEQLEARQILKETWTFKEAETFTLKGFGSRSHSCANERLTHVQILYYLGKPAAMPLSFVEI